MVWWWVVCVECGAWCMMVWCVTRVWCGLWCVECGSVVWSSFLDGSHTSIRPFSLDFHSRLHYSNPSHLPSPLLHLDFMLTPHRSFSPFRLITPSITRLTRSDPILISPPLTPALLPTQPFSHRASSSPVRMAVRPYSPPPTAHQPVSSLLLSCPLLPLLITPFLPSLFGRVVSDLRCTARPTSRTNSCLMTYTCRRTSHQLVGWAGLL